MIKKAIAYLIMGIIYGFLGFCLLVFIYGMWPLIVGLIGCGVALLIVAWAEDVIGDGNVE